MNRHQEHIEDLVFTDPKRALKLMNKIIDGKVDLTLKVDGAPSFVVGREPKTGDLFVSTKSYFNMKPIYHKDTSNISDEHLAYKFDNILREFRNVDLPHVLQGDFLFGPDCWGYEREHHVVHPNTLLYGWKKRPEGRLGVAFHTSYADGKPSPYLRNDFNIPDRVYVMPINVDHGKYDMSNSCASVFSDYYDPIIDDVAKSIGEIKHLLPCMRTAINSLIRNQKPLELDNFIDGVLHQLEKAFSAYKTAAKRDEVRSSIRAFRFLSASSNFSTWFRFYVAVGVAKRLVINKLNSQADVKTFVKTTDGFINPSQHEGYVVFDGGEAIKLVNRRHFSYHNFSPYILRGWEKPMER